MKGFIIIYILDCLSIRRALLADAESKLDIYLIVVIRFMYMLLHKDTNKVQKWKFTSKFCCYFKISDVLLFE